MSADGLVRERRAAWDEFAGAVEELYARGPRRVRPERLRLILHAYRDVSADLARLRAVDADPALIHRINRLVVRAHGQIYRAAGRERFDPRSFITTEYPRLFRETWRYTAMSFAISACFALMAFFTVQTRPDIIADILGGADTEFRGEKTGEDIRGRFRHGSAPEISSMVTTNNIIVALNAFALGITFGAGTVYTLIVNGAMVGGFAGAYARSGAGSEFWMTVMTHGALELSAIVIAGGAGLIMGHALWCPGQRTRRRALRESATQAAKLVLGLIPAFMVAGFFEGFVTPREDLPPALKVGAGVLVATVFWAYLLIAGRERVTSVGASARSTG